LTLLQEKLRCAALVLLIVCAASDFADGYFARKFNAESTVGAALDPIADKVFLNCVLWGILIYREWNLEWLAIAIALTLRDVALLIIGGIFVVSKKTIDMKPIWLSKICTALVFALCMMTLIFDGDPGILKITRHLCLLCVIITAAIYARRGYRA
jgi:cardiolipin synthase